MHIDRRAFGRTRGHAAGLALFLLALLAPRVTEPQAVDVALRTAAMLGQGMAASFGVRVDVGSARAGIYGHVDHFMTSQGCETSLPPTCNHPSTSGTALSGGVRVAFPRLGRTYPVVAAGVGALMWRDNPPYRSRTGLLMECELGVRGALVSWADYTIGLKLQRAGQGVSGGMRLESKGGMYSGFVAGLVIPLRRK